MSDICGKEEVAKALAEKLNCYTTTGRKMYDAFCEVIEDQLSAGNGVSLRGIGKIFVKTKKERGGYNPRTREAIIIPARKAVGFKASQKMEVKLNTDDEIDV